MSSTLLRASRSSTRSQLTKRSLSEPAVRHFGNSERILRFGHAGLPDSWVRTLTFSGLTVMITGCVINWKFLKDEYGITVPFFTKLFTKLGGDDEHPNTKKYNKFHSTDPKAELQMRKADILQFFAEEDAIKAQKRLEKPPPPEELELQQNDEFLSMLGKRRERNTGGFFGLRAESVTENSVETEEDRIEFLKMFLAKSGLRAEAAQNQLESDDEASDVEKGGEDKSVATPGPQKVGFRNRKIIEYENRIRQYSTPDKIFRYFATYKVVDDKGHSEVMMTPEDFLRSITPGVQQPEHLGLDQYHTVSLEELTHLPLSLGVDEESIFYHLGSGGLISFSDYIFLLTVLSTSRRHFEIAFKMFDLNGDGNVDAKEFEVVTNLMKSQSSMGIRHRDHQNTGSTFKGINSGLINYFFGEKREGILTVDKFLDFQRQLQNEILALEFKRKSSEGHAEMASKSLITEKDFAELLIAYAGFSSKKKAKMLKRVRREFVEDNALGITLGDYLSFYQVLYSINDIDTALTFYHIAGAPIERSTMKHVARTVAGVDLSDHIVAVVFVLFDENGDGKLSNKEFVSVMKQRAMRGLEKPKDTGIGKIFSAMTKCAADTRPTILGGLRKTE